MCRSGPCGSLSVSRRANEHILKSKTHLSYGLWADPQLTAGNNAPRIIIYIEVSIFFLLSFSWFTFFSGIPWQHFNRFKSFEILSYLVSQGDNKRNLSSTSSSESSETDLELIQDFQRIPGEIFSLSFQSFLDPDIKESAENQIKIVIFCAFFVREASGEAPTFFTFFYSIIAL